MSMESLPAAGPQMAAHGVDGARRGAAPAADEGTGSAFQALLACMGKSGAAGSDPAVADALAADAVPVAAGRPQDVPLVHDGPADLPSASLPPPALQGLAGNPWAAPAAVPPPVSIAPGQAMARAGGAVGGAGAGAAIADGRPASASAASEPQAPGEWVAAAGARRPGLGQAQAQSALPGAGEPPDDAAAHERMAWVATAQRQEEAASAPLRQPAAPAAVAVAAQLASLFEVGADGLRPDARWRSQERTGAREHAMNAAPGIAALADPDAAGTRHGASPVYAPGAPSPAPAAAVAERVHYWVARGVQSAELQLDAFGGGSVDVRIALRGDEAMVEFRTDQAQARQLLAEAMPQLRDLLASTGLTLAGGFVGGFGQSGTGSQGREAPAQPRGEAPVRADAATLVGATRVGSATGTTVDLFV